MKTAEQAYALLTEGNHRYANDSTHRNDAVNRTRGHEFIKQQSPHTIVVGCSDSRVPVEMIFDQGFGDLFVVRVAGNILAPSLVGSVEFAAAELGSRLVVVLGHRHCGAIGATIKSAQESRTDMSPNVHAIVDTIRSNLSGLVDLNSGIDEQELSLQAMRANVSASTEFLRRQSPVLGPLIENEGLQVLGAEFDVETGKVDFFDGVPLDA